MKMTASSREKPLVLVVDDDPAMRLLMREALERTNFEVEEAEDGVGALETLAQRRPDVVLLDVLMPDMDGFTALSELRKLPESKDLPVSIVTGLEDFESVRQAYASGATDFIVKPIHWPNLGNHVRHLLMASRAFAELRDSRAFLQSILEDIPHLICRCAPDGTITFVNDAYCRYFGKSSDELIGSSFMALIPEEDRQKVRQYIATIGPENPVTTFEHSVIRTNGEIRRQRWTNRALFDPNGAITQVQSIGEDVTEQRLAEENLHLAREIFENCDELIAITDANADIVDVNPAFTRLTGYAREEVIGKNIRLLGFELTDPYGCVQPLYEYHAESLRRHGRWQGETRGRRKNGQRFTSLITINALKDDRGEATRFVSLSTDITNLKVVEEKLRHLAFFDPLTGLPNRDLMRDRLQQAIYGAARDKTMAALLFLDLDNFKDINDTLGHPLGDQVLAEVAQRLQARTRHSDTVARMGGDEFVIVIRHVPSSESVGTAAQGVLNTMSTPFVLDGREVFLTASIGVVLYPVDGLNPNDLIQKADTAMYHAKAQGKNRYQFFSEEMNLKAQKRLALKTDLRRAVDRDEFVVHYQPKIRLDTGKVTGVEALLRWQMPGAGLVPPGSFIPLAEETGLIVPIGEKVLRMACAQVKAWQNQGLPSLPVAVNLSAIQLRNRGLDTMIRDTLRETGLEPGCLELELTESAIMQESERAVTMLQAMKAMGVRITMDDFGTGYSSLSYLKRFPIGSLKIDHSFISEMLGNTDDMEIIRAIIAMAHRLRLKVVAEGVETAEQVEFLRQEGCEEVQGYYFARPMPAEEFRHWFQAR